MTVISGTYDMLASAPNFASATANGVVAQDYQTVNQDFELQPICQVFTDNVEGGNLGWTAQTPWAITTRSSHSPTHSWTRQPWRQLRQQPPLSLTSQTFNLTGQTGVSLNFWHTYGPKLAGTMPRRILQRWRQPGTRPPVTMAS
jgi:hypothetical protein